MRSVASIIYRLLGERLSAAQKTTLKLLLERYTDKAEKRFFSALGEDAFLQGYFRQLHQSVSKEPHHLAGDSVGTGFYVDVGAYSPKLFSNTYWFYKQGWSGINVDPTPGTAKLFNAVRPRDITLELAVSNTCGTRDFYVWGASCLQNTLSKQHIPFSEKLFGRPPHKISVATTTLKDLLSKHVPTGRTIRFMSIDVEGHDFEVVQSNDWDEFRPELVLVECLESTWKEITSAPVSVYLEERGYQIYSWLKPTLVFRRTDIGDDPLVPRRPSGTSV